MRCTECSADTRLCQCAEAERDARDLKVTNAQWASMDNTARAKHNAAVDAAKETKMTNLTMLELAVLKALDDSEYGDALTDGVWTFSVQDHMPAGVPARSLGGIVASLTKKGCVVACDHGRDAYIAMTNAGAQAYLAANPTARKHLNDAG